MRKRIGIGCLLFVAATGAIVFDTLCRAGELESLVPRPLDCRAVTGVIGPEDITIDRRRAVAYISATDARAFAQDRPARGALYRYARSDAKPQQLYSAKDGSFHPHGVGFFSDGRGPDLLYVVNHRTNTSHTIEVFEVTDAGVRLLKTIRDRLLVSPNDVVAVGRDELYVTNDHGVNRGPGQLIDDLLRRERAQILHRKDGTFRVLASDLAYANGINAHPNGKEVYVAEATGKRLRVYSRAASGDLTPKQTIELGTGPDNIEVAPDGSLYIGAHPKLLTFLRHAADPNVPSPSEVIRVTHGRVEQIYLDLGGGLSASTVATPFAGRLLIGSVFADRFLDCALP